MAGSVSADRFARAKVGWYRHNTRAAGAGNAVEAADEVYLQKACGEV
jgi:hypothetical protein